MCSCANLCHNIPHLNFPPVFILLKKNKKTFGLDGVLPSSIRLSGLASVYLFVPTLLLKLCASQSGIWPFKVCGALFLNEPGFVW